MCLYFLALLGLLELPGMFLTRSLRGNLNLPHWNRRLWEIGYSGSPLPKKKALVFCFGFKRFHLQLILQLVLYAVVL